MINTNEVKAYPTISDELLNRLKEDFPNVLPKNYVDSYELGILVGHQQVIEKLETEKAYNENATISSKSLVE